MRVLILRDPRDIVVSRINYRVWHSPFMRNDRKFLKYRKRLAQKEADPESVPFLSLLHLQTRLDGADYILPDPTGPLLEAVDVLPDTFFPFRYEDFVAGRVTELNDYLGLCLDPAVKVDEECSRVARAKRVGDWRHRFTERDVKAYRPILDPFICRFGYDSNWTLASDPMIDPEHATGYADRLRAQLPQP